MKIRLVVLDVDGVLTDGRFLVRDAGDEWKAFHAADGLGLRLLLEAGVKVHFVSGRSSPVVDRRAQELGIDGVLQGCKDKGAALRDLCARLALPVEAAAYMGDDLIDLPAMRLAGFAAAPADARPEVREAADWIAPSPGGHGAVRDLCDHILREMGLWDSILERFDR